MPLTIEDVPSCWKCYPCCSDDPANTYDKKEGCWCAGCGCGVCTPEFLPHAWDKSFTLRIEVPVLTTAEIDAYKFASGIPEGALVYNRDTLEFHTWCYDIMDFMEGGRAHPKFVPSETDVD